MKDDEHSNFPVVALGQIGEETVQTVNARELHGSLQKPVIAKGRIMGGFEGGHFGVEVSLSRPLRVRK